MVDETALANSASCSVVAPAGCGKTELIARAVGVAPADKRILVLTHTHAGVRAIRQRFKKLQVPLSRARIDTIAGWSLDFTSSYPATTGVQAETIPSSMDWKHVYAGMAKLLQISAIQKVVAASYAGAYIDEYQDCTLDQHEIAVKLSSIIPCRVLGDPLQGIFQFAGATLSWTSDVECNFPSIGQLDDPWRWKKTNPELGKWLLGVRAKLCLGQPIDLSTSLITRGKADSRSEGAIAKTLLAKTGSVIAIRTVPNFAHHFARTHKGYTSMEEMECQALLSFAEKLDKLSGHERALAVIEFASLCATKVAAICASERKKLAEGKDISSAFIRNDYKKRTVETLINVCTSNDLSYVEAALGMLLKAPHVRLIRRELLYATKDAIVALGRGKYDTLRDAAWATRNRSRHFDRQLHSRLVSRTLLEKGLEFDHAFVVNASDFVGADAAQNFYVAITRGSTSLTILSETGTVQFAKPKL
jgi:DNA helicase-2/ATP-dependent DNA helicase PcrA